MTEQQIPRTDADLDAVISALADGRIRNAADKFMSALKNEIELNRRGGFHLAVEAVVHGIPPRDLVDHFARQEADSRQRAAEMLALLDETEKRLQARRAVVQAGDGKLAALLAAIGHAIEASASAVREQSAEVEYVKHSRLVEAATAAGIDPTDLAKLRPPKLDTEIENLRRHQMNAAVGPIRSVLADPHRRTESLPEWVQNILATMGDCPGIGDFARTRYQEEVVTILKGAVTP